MAKVNSLFFMYRAFAHDVTAAILVFQNNETAAMLVYQTNPVGVELFSYLNTSFCLNKFACVKTLYKSTTVLSRMPFSYWLRY